jgi:hypothetical protein
MTRINSLQKFQLISLYLTYTIDIATMPYCSTYIRTS